MPRRNFRHTVLSLLMVMFMILCGCSQGQVTATLPPATTPQPTSAPMTVQGTLRLRMPTQILTWHPLRSSQRDVRSLLGLVYEPLIELNGEGEPVGALAASWTLDEATCTWTFNLRQNVKWHSGETFTAQDVIHTLDMLKEIADTEDLSSPYEDRLKWFVRWSAPDDNTLVLVTTDPYYGILHALDFPIIRASSDMTSSANPTRLVGTGPYRMDSLSSQEMILTSQDAWWKKKPSIDTIRVAAYSDTQSAVSALYLQQLDAVQASSSSLDSYEFAQNVQHYSYVTPYFTSLVFNLQSEKVGTPAMRQAIAYGIDRSEIVSDVYVGNAIQVDAPIMTDSWLFDGKLLTFSYLPEYTRTTLEKVGWHKEKESDPYYNVSPGGIHGEYVLRLLVSESTDSHRAEVARLIQSQLKKVGIRVDIVTLPFEEYRNAMRNGEYDLALASWYLSKVPDMTEMLHATGSLNWNGYYSGHMNTLLEEARRQSTASGLKKITDDICDLLVQDLPWMSLFFESHTLMITSELTGITAVSEDDAYRSIDEWTFTEK